MPGPGVLDLVYAVAVAAYIGLLARRDLARRGLAWKLKAAGAWLLIFAGMFVAASHMGLALP